MIRIDTAEDLNWANVYAIAYENAQVELGQTLLEKVEAGRQQFLRLIEAGVPCYGVTTGLGQLVTVNLSDTDKRDLPKNILRARAAAIGEPMPAPVVRATMTMRLVNFLSAMDGVTPALCEFIAARLNDGFTPWIPRIGHGMAADAIANTHCFQTLIGEGYVVGPQGRRMPALEALEQRGVEPFDPGQKEGLALLNGIALAPAYAMHAHQTIAPLIDLATLVACASYEAIAAPKDSIDAALIELAPEPGVCGVLRAMIQHLRGSQITAFKLQSPVSIRIVPQVHGAAVDALEQLAERIDNSLGAFTDNPVMSVDQSHGSGRFLSNGAFHNQHLVNQVEHLAIALAHVGALSERRLQRLLDPSQTGLNPQLAPRPGLDAGLVVAHKAAIDVSARLKMLANPISLLTSETSAGQEDYMSMAVPAIDRVFEMVTLVKILLSYELCAASVALDARAEKPGASVQALHAAVRQQVPVLNRDRSPGPDVERILSMLDNTAIQTLLVPTSTYRHGRGALR